MHSFNEFIKHFKNHVNELLESELIYGRQNKDILLNTEWTFLINIAMYKTVESYSKKNRKRRIMIQPETSGRFPSDFTIFSPRGRKIFVIEHENSHNLRKIIRNYKKLAKIKDCDYRLLICYSKQYLMTENPLKSVIQQLRKIKSQKRYRKEVKVLIAYKCKNQLFEDANSYELYTV